MATPPIQQEVHWRDRFIARSEGISDAWEVAKAYAARLAEWILLCGYHANKTRRFKQRLPHIYKTNRPRTNRMYQSSSLDEQITLSDVFSGLAGCFSIPLGGMIWLAWFSSASFAMSMIYWTIVACVTLVASVILWLKWF